MNLRGQFNWIKSLRFGGRKAISFTLSCTNLLYDEDFDAAILDSSGSIQPMYFMKQTIPARKSLRFDYDTVGWDWCQGDKFVILDKKGNIKAEWVVNMQTYAFGECPSCHGTHKCTTCSGTGRITHRHTHMIETCQSCAGTGECQTCYIPIRVNSTIGNSMGVSQPSNHSEVSKQREIAAINSRIYELRSKIEKIEWDLRIMKLKDQSYNSHTTYTSILQLKFTYEQQLIKLQTQLHQLESF